jgi:hypothetical protein
MLKRMPEEYKTQEMFLAILQNWKYRFNDLLKYIPKQLKTNKFYYEAVKVAGDVLGELPWEKRTPGMCEAAVASNGFAIKHVPEKYVTPGLCRSAVTQAGTALQYVPARYITPELCKIAIHSDPWALEFVQAGQQTLEMCLEAVRTKRPRSFERIREVIGNESEAIPAANRPRNPVAYVADEFRTPEVMAAAGES